MTGFPQPYTSFVDISKEIGRRIRTAREATGLSLSALAAHTSNLTKSRIGNWEQGTRRPRTEEAQELARVLGVSAAYLLCLDEDSTLTQRERKLVAAYRQADERGKDTIMGTAESQSEYRVTTTRRRNTS